MIADGVVTSYQFSKMAAIASQIYGFGLAHVWD